MKAQTEIQWSQAQQVQAREVKVDKEEQARYLQDFLESTCDIFSSADFEYYAEMTGKTIQWIMSNAKFSETEEDRMQWAAMDNDYELIDLMIN
jgi:hypothetical protein